MIEIIGPSVSPFVVKLLAAADYKGIEYTHTEQVSIRELAKLNPQTGKVPVVRFDGEAAYDSTLILRRFDLVWPARPLFADDPRVAAKQRLLEDWSDESLYWCNQALRWCPENEARTIAQNSRFVPAAVRPFAKPLLRRLVGRQPKAQGLGRLPYDVLIAEMGQRLDDLVQVLGDYPFFYSDRPSAADFAIFGVFSTGLKDGVTPDFAKLVLHRQALSEWFDRVENARHRDAQNA